MRGVARAPIAWFASAQEIEKAPSLSRPQVGDEDGVGWLVRFHGGSRGGQLAGGQARRRPGGKGSNRTSRYELPITTKPTCTR